MGTNNSKNRTEAEMAKTVKNAEELMKWFNEKIEAAKRGEESLNAIQEMVSGMYVAKNAYMNTY